MTQPATSSSSSNRFPELDKYELLEEVGHGGMATVYRARDLRLEREVAVKVIHKHLRENAEVRRRFVAEAKAVAKLRHPGIVEVYDVSDEAEEERFLVVELIRGLSLRQLLQKRGALPPEVAGTLVATLCDAVEHAHQSGVIHRDIKPENVLLELPDSIDDSPDTEPDSECGPDSEGSVSSKTAHDSEVKVSSLPREPSINSGARVVIKLTDFGIAKVLDAQGVTSTGQILGSPAHMAPEQIEGGEIGPHTDVFALGVLMYECMVGHLPFEGRNPAQVLRRVLEGNFDPADGERPEIGGRWSRIIAEALAVKAPDRIQTAAELAALIREELAAVGVENPQADIVDYFVDTAAYEQRVVDELVPRLVKRGEVERRAGRIPGAAADFNRALALKPDDMTILKRVSSLSAETVWKERAVRFGGLVLLASAALGGAFMVSRWVRGDPLSPDDVIPDVSVNITTAAPTSRDVAPPEPPKPDPSATASAVVKPKVGPVVGPVTSSSADETAADPGVRMVLIKVSPQGAQLTVRGAPYTFFPIQAREMAVGSHSFVLSVRGGCCEEVRSAFTVPPLKDGEDPAKVVVIGLSAKIKPAMIVLEGHPAGATVNCRNAVSSGNAAKVLMTKTTWSGSCHFSDSKGKSAGSTPVTLKAGQTASIPWPG